MHERKRVLGVRCRAHVCAEGKPGRAQGARRKGFCGGGCSQPGRDSVPTLACGQWGRGWLAAETGRGRGGRGEEAFAPSPGPSEVGRGRKGSERGEHEGFQDQGQGVSPWELQKSPSGDDSPGRRLTSDPNLKPPFTWSQSEPQS